jgi:hypothetical protein
MIRKLVSTTARMQIKPSSEGSNDHIILRWVKIKYGFSS